MPDLLGYLNINKSPGMTSHDVVNKVRRIVGSKHVGHAGTLDPLATGVLPVGIGAACRLMRYFPGGKIYLAEILLGRTTTTDDIAGETIDEHRGTFPEADAIVRELQKFVGEIDQVPPMYSAIHKDGERLYDLARKGVAIAEIPARKVQIDRIDVISCAPPVVTARIACGTGTYIRSIARDLGKVLGTGGCLQSLVREKSGAFELDQSVSLDQLADLASAGDLDRAVISPRRVFESASLPTVEATPDIAKRLSMGQKIALDSLPSSVQSAAISIRKDERTLIVVSDDWLIAACRVAANDAGEAILRPEVVVLSRASN